jgi:hypothetical protein
MNYIAFLLHIWKIAASNFGLQEAVLTEISVVFSTLRD